MTKLSRMLAVIIFATIVSPAYSQCSNVLRDTVTGKYIVVRNGEEFKFDSKISADDFKKNNCPLNEPSVDVPLE